MFGFSELNFSCPSFYERKALVLDSNEGTHGTSEILRRENDTKGAVRYLLRGGFHKKTVFNLEMIEGHTSR